MIRWVKQRLHRWLETSDQDLVPDVRDQIPASNALVSIKLAYWNDVLSAAKSREGKRLLYRVQLMYNLQQVELRRLDPRDTAKMAAHVAKMQAFWDVLSLERVASQKVLAYASDAQRLEDEDTAE